MTILMRNNGSLRKPVDKFSFPDDISIQCNESLPWMLVCCRQILTRALQIYFNSTHHFSSGPKLSSHTPSTSHAQSSTIAKTQESHTLDLIIPTELFSLGCEQLWGLWGLWTTEEGATAESLRNPREASA